MHAVGVELSDSLSSCQGLAANTATKQALLKRNVMQLSVHSMVMTAHTGKGCGHCRGPHRTLTSVTRQQNKWCTLLS